MFLHAKTWHAQRLTNLQFLKLFMCWKVAYPKRGKQYLPNKWARWKVQSCHFQVIHCSLSPFQEQQAWFESGCPPSLFSERKSMCPCPLLINCSQENLEPNPLWGSVCFSFLTYIFSTCSDFSYLLLAVGLQDKGNVQNTSMLLLTSNAIVQES